MDIAEYKNPGSKNLEFPDPEHFRTGQWIIFDTTNPTADEQSALKMATGTELPIRSLYVCVPQVWDVSTETFKRGHAPGFAIPLSDDEEPIPLVKSFNLFLRITTERCVYQYGLYFVLYEVHNDTPYKVGFPTPYKHYPRRPRGEPEFLVFFIYEDPRIRAHIKEYIKFPLPNYEIGYAVVYNPNNLESHRFGPGRTSVNVKMYAVGKELIHKPIEIPGAFLLFVGLAVRGRDTYHGMIKGYIEHFADCFAKDHEIVPPVERYEDAMSRAVASLVKVQRFMFSCISREQLIELVVEFDQKGDAESRCVIFKRIEELMTQERERSFLYKLFESDDKRIELKELFLETAGEVQAKDVSCIARHFHVETKFVFHSNPPRRMGNQ